MDNHDDLNFQSDEEGTLILDEEIDEDYEPTAEEILEYAIYIGMDPVADKDLFYIAKEGLKAPLPQNWKPIQTREGEIYYHNFDSKESQWEHPCDEHYKKVFLDAKKALALKNKDSKNSKARGRLADALSLQKDAPLQLDAPVLMEGPTIEEFQSPKFFDCPALQVTQEKEIPEQLEASFSQDNGSFVSSLNTYIKPGDAKQGENSFEEREISGLQYGMEDSFDGRSEKLGLSSLEAEEEFQEKLKEFSESREREISELQLKLHKELQQKRDKYEKDLKRSIDGLKVQLNEGQSASHIQLEEDLELIKSEIASEFSEKYKLREKEMKEGVIGKIKKYEDEESNKQLKELELYKKKIVDEFEHKKTELMEQRRGIEVDTHRMRLEDNRRKETVNQRISQTLRKIEENFKQLLKDIEVEESLKQATQLENLHKELENKIEQEKKTLAIAQKQKFALQDSKKRDLRRHYEDKFQKEKTMLDKFYQNSIAGFEQKENTRTENKVAKLSQQELKAEKDKRIEAARKEKDELKQAVTRRLDNFRAILKEKLESEKLDLTQKVEQATSYYKQMVREISTNVTRKEDFFAEITKLERLISDSDIKALDVIIGDQRNDNQRLKERIEEIKKEFKSKEEAEKTKKRVYDSLKKKIQEKDKEIQHSLSNIDISSVALNTTKRSVSPVNTSIPLSRDNNPSALVTLKREFDEIKALVTAQNQGRPSDTREIENLDSEESSIVETSNMRTGIPLSSHERIARLNEWDKLLKLEIKKLGKLKEHLLNDKILLKRAQKYVLMDQEKYRQESASAKENTRDSAQAKNRLKTLKDDLNKQVSKLNQEIYIIRENEAKIKSKETALRKIGEAFTNIADTDDFEELKSLYNFYKEMEVSYREPFVENEQKFELSSALSGENDSEVKNFYQRWKGVLETETGLQLQNEGIRTQIPTGVEVELIHDSECSELEASSFDFERKYDRLMSRATQNYDNLNRVLDTKLKTHLPDQNHFLAKRDIMKSTDTKNRVAGIFQDHAQWLKTLKLELNTHIYNKPQTLKPGAFGKLFI